jgi:diaminopimelate decarboxylase
MNTHLEYKKSKLHFCNLDLSEVAKSFKTPFFLYSEDILSTNYNTFFQGAVEAGLINPLVCFAMKANPSKALLQILAKLGSGADIVSGGELRRALEAGIPANKIVFSGVGKTEEEIEYALKVSRDGVYSFNVESIEELELINKIARKLRKKARICFRLNPVVQAKTHKHISTGNRTHKFGLLASDIEYAIAHSKYWSHSKLVGLSVHIGSQLLDLMATKKAIIKLSELSLKSNAPLEFIDVGGGLGVDYHPQDSERLPSIETYMGLVASTLSKHYYGKTHHRPRVVFEPGRRVVAKAGIFVMKVVRNKISENNRFVIVDGGMNDFMRPSLYEAYHDLLSLKKGLREVPTHVVGPICETSDCFATNRLLPELKSGDYLILCDAGAYGFSMGSNYNLRGRPLELLLDKKQKLKILNQAQPYEKIP